MSKKTLKQVFASLAIATLTFAAATTPTLLTPAPANAMTGDEFVKFIGVFGRYLSDLDKIFGNGAQAVPTDVQPDIPAPDPTEAQ
jgi:hypothetical protein